MFARAIVNRKWVVAAAVAAILAVVIGVQLGRSVIPSGTAHRATTVAPKPIQFRDAQSGLALKYPRGWTRLSVKDPQVRLVAAASPATSLLLRVSRSDLADVTVRTLPVVRSFTDDLIGADNRARLLSAPEEVSVGGLPGFRYRYTYTTSDGKIGAHVHYFLFKHKRLVQLVFQQVPSPTLPNVEPAFNRIAGSLVSSGR
ncbi:MAG: hypothetical protein QOE11_1987 [Solirubrobacteraceae bacterium]|jgi:hypothetical protein|nr:hypothetical protein [Solirubrobacteraceae bacterium]